MREHIESIIVNEGGYQNMPEDSGNYTGRNRSGRNLGTNMGITPRTLAAHRKVNVTELTAEDMEFLTKDEACEIYEHMYIRRPKFHLLPKAIQATVIDSGVMSGTRRATKMLQRLVGTTEDGYIGLITIDASQNVTAKQYNDERRGFYERLVKRDPKNTRFLRGWFNRVAKFDKGD